MSTLYSRNNRFYTNFLVKLFMPYSRAKFAIFFRLNKAKETIQKSSKKTCFSNYESAQIYPSTNTRACMLVEIIVC